MIQPVKLAQAYRYANTLPSACERRYASSYIAWMNGGACGWQPACDPMIAVRRGLPLSKQMFGIIATTRRLTPEERAEYQLAIA